MKFIKIIVVVVFLFSASVPCIVFSDDLDDGISNHTDDSIKKWDQLGQKDRNVTFIKMNAKSKAMVMEKSGQGLVGSNASGTGSGSANMNSVVMGAGSTVKGDIIIIDDSKGDKTLVSD